MDADRISRRAERFADILGPSRLDESVMALGEPAIHLRFDPRLHPRDRVGEFSGVLEKVARNGHGSSVELPHGVSVKNRLGKLHVHSPYSPAPISFHDPGAAAGVALAHVDRGEIEHGADAASMHHARLNELTQLRSAVVKTPHFGDVEKVEAEIGRVRMERGQLAPVIPVHRGRSYASVEDYRARHHTDTPHLADAFAQAHAEQAPKHLPAASDAADKVRPSLDLDKLEVKTGYGRFHVKENPMTQGFYDLHHDDRRLGAVGTRRAAEHALGALHDEALERHMLRKLNRRADRIREALFR